MHDLIEIWLRGSWRRFGLGFPDPLEALFETDTRRERSLTLAIYSAVGACAALLFYPTVVATLPDIPEQVRFVYRDLCLPITGACVFVLLFNPRPVVREAFTALVNGSFSVSVVGLFVTSRATEVPALVTAALVLITYSALGVQLRFPYAMTAVSWILAALAVGLHMRPDFTEVTREKLLLLAVFIALCALLANWRLERQSRRGYLLSLREQLRHQEMAMRNRDLDELARRDPLTGLANRRAYDAALAQAWQVAVETGGELGLIVIDIDRFKLYNDFYGHASGDSCLQKIARCLADQLRGTSDLIARLGGEEFAVLLPVLNATACADIAERLRLSVAALELPHRGLGRLGMVSLSAGVATRLSLGGEATPDRLFAAADSALYQAKQQGRDRICVAAG